MTVEVEFFSPSDAVDPTKVRRSKDGRPYVKQPCPNSAAIWRDWPLPDECVRTSSPPLQQVHVASPGNRYLESMRGRPPRNPFVAC